MTYQRRAYDDPDTTSEMHRDCDAAALQMHLPVRRLPDPAEAALEPAPSIRYEDFPSEVRKREITVSDAAARLAARMHLHLH
jgi:hypothetical protein